MNLVRLLGLAILVIAQPVFAQEEPAAVKKARAAVAKDGWNTYRILAKGKHIQLWLNGIKTVDYTEKDADIAADGVIAIQIHGKMQALIAYKDITIKELPSGK